MSTTLRIGELRKVWFDVIRSVPLPYRYALMKVELVGILPIDPIRHPSGILVLGLTESSRLVQALFDVNNFEGRLRTEQAIKDLTGKRPCLQFMHDEETPR
jgi:hypothetical protein